MVGRRAREVTGVMEAFEGRPPPCGDGGSVYVPLHELPHDGEAMCELRTLTDGRSALLTYPSARELVDCCGPGQPWMEVPAARVGELRDATGAEVVVTGVELPAEIRHPEVGGGA